jgi:bla regulator protein blaR1
MVSMLTNHLWQSTLFALAVALAIRQLRNDAARVRYALWLAASVKFLIPFSLLSALGAQLAPRAAPSGVLGPWPAALERFAEPLEPSALPGPLALVLLGAWALGAAAVVGYWSFQAQRISALVRHASPAGAALPGRSSLPVRFAATQLEPALIGLFRPVLLLPQGIEKHLSPAQLQAVVAHEHCHWHRRDNVTAAAHMLVEALFWFHPLVWWLGARLVEERERACDEAVIEAGHDRKSYAEAILGICELRVTAPLKCAAGVGGADLKRRITSIMRRSTMARLQTRKKLMLGITASAAIALPIAAGWLTAANAQDEVQLPIVRVAPVYPQAAADARLEGFVLLEYTVTETGAVVDPIVIESSSTVFERSAIEAALKFKYQPKTINGQPVAVPYVRNRFSYVLEHDGENAENERLRVQARERALNRVREAGATLERD